MSLFKARDWWSATLGEGEEFDQGCLCVGDVDNSGTGHDKVVVGSYMGMLRIFSPHASKTIEGGQADAQLLEVQLQNAIIQVELGKFVSCSELLHLAVLHPRKLSVYSVSGTAGNVEHGDQYQLKLVYEHNLQRTACNMTYGTFGGVTGHHSLCIQSMDGMLMFFEQDSYSFGRFLPGFLLPGPLTYNPRTDSFLTVSSARELESYKYETLAVATEAESRQDPNLPLKTGGKRLTPDWVFVLGEQALDLCVPSFSHASSHIFILGERNIYCLRDNGQIHFMKKLEFNPSCFLPYASGVPKVLQSRFNLPPSLVCVACPPPKATKFKITVDTNQPPVDLSSIFREFSAKSEDKDGNSLAFQLLSGAKVTVLASKTSQRYRIQSDSFEDMWLVVKELVHRFDQHFSKLGIKDFKKSFSGPLPLEEYFLSVDKHFQLRVSAQKYQDLLSERAVQFRAIQRRLLTRFKDKTPAPLQNLDTLMDATYSQVMALAEAAEENRALLEEAFVRLRSATHLLVLLLSLWQGLTPDQTSILEATLLPLLQDTPQLGWEESCDAAVSHLLRTCLSQNPKDQATSLAQTGGSVLGLPSDTARLKKHITLLCERIGKGGRLTLASEANVQVPAQVQNLAVPGGVEPIAELAGDGEEIEVPQEATKFIKKKQPSKKTKKEKEKKEVSKEPSEASVKEEEPIKETKKEKKESSKEKKESKKESTKEPKEEAKKESKKESSSSKEKKESSKEKKEKEKEKEGKEAGDKKVSRRSSVKVKEKKKEPEAAEG
uniref:Bardet-Biedl syndrome 9 n=1 Tax=Astatotilapia calliptera TaxID=8154 RepID=A0A3P8NM91_ASTCA